MKFIVKRSSQGEDGALYHPIYRTRSILGFLGKACNIPDKEMAYLEFPSSVLKTYFWPKGILNKNGYNSVFTKKIINIIYSINTSIFETENKVTNLFDQLDIEVLFED